MTGHLFTVVGPSGAGKDTLLALACAQRPDLALVRRVITRPETAGSEAFDGVSEGEFAKRLAAGQFALNWQAHGLSYGIPKSELAPLARGGDVVFNGSRAALVAAAAQYPALKVILVTAPADILARRLAARGREDHADIAARVSRAAMDLPAGLSCIEVINDSTPEAGAARLLAALRPQPAKA